jgi:hypothetical protein
MSVTEIQALHGAYIRLTEKFKALWAFHQFLKAVHRTFLGGEPSHTIEFNALYEKLREISSEMSVEANTELVDRLRQIDLELDTAVDALRKEDRALPPSLVRRFFERVRTHDDKIAFHLLCFYFLHMDVDEDVLDKVDFLVTLAACSAGSDGELRPRERIEMRRLFEAVCVHSVWPRVEDAQALALMHAFDDLAGDVERAGEFEQLLSEHLLENIRTLKRRAGTSIAHPDVLTAMACCNLATKSVFQKLYEGELRRILDAANRVEELAREFTRGGDESELPEEFRRFREIRDGFAQRERERLIRTKDVLALKQTIGEVLTKFDVSGIGEEDIEEALEFVAEPPARREPEDAEFAHSMTKLLASIEMADDANGPGRLLIQQELAHLRLEPWEIRAGRRAVTNGGEPVDGHDRLLIHAAALRLLCSEQATEWSRRIEAGQPIDGLVPAVQKSLHRAEALDEEFRRASRDQLDGSALREARAWQRSRYRLLRVYAGLWLLYDEHVVE